MSLLRFDRAAVIAMTVACALFMENLDGTVIATALPQIAVSFGVNPVHLSLAITSYLLSVAIFIPASGWAADRFGARTIFRAAIAVFMAGSICCGLSQNLAELTASRILQGMGGAMMVPVGRLVLLRSVAKSELVRTMSYLTVPAMLGPVLGPPVGGFIATYASWPWIFFLNIPIGVLGLVLVSALIANDKAPETPPLDLAGFALSGLALAGLMMGLETIGREGVPQEVTLALIAVGLVAGLLYIRHAGRCPHPILDLLMFRIPTFAVAVGAGWLFRTGVGAIPFLLPLMLQLGFGLTPFASGLLTFMSAVGAMTMKFTARPILRRFGFRRVLVGNAVISAAFLLSYAAFRPGTPHLVILALLLTGGFFRSLQFTALNGLAYADIDQPQMSRATTMSTMGQRLAQSIGIGLAALMIHLFQSQAQTRHVTAAVIDPAFLIIGGVALVSALFFVTLPADAGAELHGKPVRSKI